MSEAEPVSADVLLRCRTCQEPITGNEAYAYDIRDINIKPDDVEVTTRTEYQCIPCGDAE